jgi:hypothetical protein
MPCKRQNRELSKKMQLFADTLAWGCDGRRAWGSGHGVGEGMANRDRQDPQVTNPPPPTDDCKTIST